MNTAVFAPNYQQIDLNTQQDDFLDEDRIQQLEIIDKLRELGVGDDISLPQLVVVGDQSSGKSSLLEGLTGLPFPVASQLCTRFATKVSFRRLATAPRKKTITITIIPAKDALEPYKQKLASFSRKLTDLTAETFSDILKRAAALMGLPGPGDNIEHATKRFSSDVLKIEIVGPEQQQLSVVDVPGLYHNPTKEQTASDLTRVRALIESYVRDERTIIMAVLDSRNNLANQEVFRIAKIHDPEQTRTIGVMTKLDALQAGDEQAAFQIACNETERLKLGWYCVRNRSTEDINNGVTVEQREINEEEFFTRPVWRDLDKRLVGINSLLKALAKLLLEHIDREFPKIEKEIDLKYQTCSDELQAMGKAREFSQDQREFLIGVSNAYEKRVKDALDGRYWASGMHPSNLRMHIRNEADKFNTAMHQRGATLTFNEADYGTSRPCSSVSAALVPQDIYKEIADKWRECRGVELPGQISPAGLQKLFGIQTSKWRVIAMDYIATIIRLIREFNSALFEKVCPDPHIRDKIRNKIEEETESSFASAYKALDDILIDECDKPLFTNNLQFTDNLSTARHRRLGETLTKLGFRNGQPTQRIDIETMRLVHLDPDTATVYEIHDMLKAYYQVALNRFVDNVSIQVIERNLCGTKGPVSIFNALYVGRLNSEDLAAIAGEDETSSTYRQALKAQIERLEKAKKICAEKSTGVVIEGVEAEEMVM
ncbi:MAG: hypothetical protein Q9187_002408 [Circinaria calcarea]